MKKSKKILLSLMLMIAVVVTPIFCSGFSVNQFIMAYSQSDLTNILNNYQDRSNEIDPNMTLDSAYCLKDDYYILTENQGSQNMGWAFASTNALSTTLMKATNMNYNFSEGYVSLALNHAFLNNNCTNLLNAEKYAMQSSNYSYKAGDANFFWGFDEIAREYGLVFESDFAYENSFQLCDENINQKYNFFSSYAINNIMDKVEGVRFPCYHNQPNKNDIILAMKQHIVNHGSIYAGIDYSGPVKTQIDSYNIYYKLPSSNTNIKHAVSLIGWDDNLSVTVNGKTYTGAWIAQNSRWETSQNVGTDGIVYIFYEDTDFEDNFFGYVYNEKSDDLNIKLVSSNANFSTNLKGKYYSNFEQTTNTTKQKNVFYSGDISLTYSVNEALSSSDKIKSVQIFKNGIDVSENFNIQINFSEKRVFITTKSSQEAGEYKVVFASSKKQETCQFFVNSGFEISFITQTTSPKEDYVKNNGYYNLFNSYSNSVDFYVNRVNETEQNLNAIFTITFSTYSSVVDVLTDDEYVTITKNLENNKCTVSCKKHDANDKFKVTFVSENGTTKDFEFRTCMGGSYYLQNANVSVIHIFEQIDENQKIVEKQLGRFEDSSANDDPYILIDDPVREGYSFIGWYYTNTFNESSKLQRSEQKHASYLMLDNPKVFNKTSVSQGESLKKEFNSNYTRICEVFVYAKWEKSYKVTFEAQQATSTNHTKELNLRYEEKFPSSITVPTREGYTFEGYYTSSGERYYDGNGKRDAGHKQFLQKTSLTLYARWSLEEYEIWFLADTNEDGKLEIVSTLSYNINSKIKIPYISIPGFYVDAWSPTDPKTDYDGNYDLEGYYLADAGNWDVSNNYYAPISQWDDNGNIFENKYGDVWFVAQLTKRTFNITFEIASGSASRLFISQTPDGPFGGDDIRVEAEYGKTYTIYAKSTDTNFSTFSYYLADGLEANVNISLYQDNVYKIELSDVSHSGIIVIFTTKDKPKYRIEHYKQNKTLDGYDLVEYEEKEAEQGTTVSVNPYYYDPYTWNFDSGENKQSYEYFVFDSTIEGTKISGTVTNYGSLVLKCFYKRKTFNLTYIIDGVDVTNQFDVKTFAYGQVVELPIPEKSGYDFVGWNLSGKSAEYKLTKLNDGIDFISNLALYGTFVKTSAYGNNITAYHYVESLSQTAGENRIRFVNNGKSLYYEQKEVEYNVTTSMYSYLWKDYNGFSKNEYILEKDGNDVEIKFFYSRNQYVLTFEKVDGVEKIKYQIGSTNYDYSSPIIVSYGQSITISAEIKENYKFVKFEDVDNPSNTKTEQTFSFEMPNYNVTFKAVAKKSVKVNYTVNYYTENIGIDNPDESNPDHFTKFDSIEVVGEVDDVTNVNPSTKVGFSLQPITQQTIKEDGTTVVNVYYYRNSYTINFNVASSQKVNSIDYEFGTSFDLPVLSDTGYKFDGWYENDSYTGTKITSIQTTDYGNKTLYGRLVESDETPYVVNHYIESLDQTESTGKICFEDGIWYELKTTENLQGTTNQVITPDVLNIDGFTAPNTKECTILADGSLVCNYLYSRNTYSLDISTDDEIFNATGAGNYKFEQEVTIMASVLQGYLFDKYVDATTLDVLSNSSTFKFNMPAKNLEIKALAKGDPNTIFVVNYYKENVGIDDPDENNPEHFTKFNSEQFKGETGTLTNVEPDVENGFSAKAVVQQKILADNSTIVNVYYLRDVYTVTFNLQNANKTYPLNELEYEFGTSLSLPTFVQAGYDFDAWYDNADFTGIKTLQITTTDFGDKVMYGRFMESDFIPYTIYHYTESLIQQAGDERVFNSVTNLYYDIAEIENLFGTTNMTIEVNPQNFEGFTSPSKEEILIKPDGTARADFYYSRNSYTLTLNNTNGVNLLSESGEYKFGKTISLSAQVLAGYTFDGWIDEDLLKTSKNLDFDFVMPAKNITLVAQALANTNTKYVVNYFTQNLDVDTPDENESSHWTKIDTKTLYGTTDALSNAEATPVEGFDAKTIVQKQILGDESTIVNVYYLRKILTLTIETPSGISVVSGSGQYKFGENVIVNCQVKVGYSFSNWYDKTNYKIVSNQEEYSFVMPGTNLTLQPQALANTNTKYVVNIYTENFNVASPDESNLSDWTKIDTQEKFGETDKLTQIVAETLEGFSAKTIIQKQILGDESTIVNVYYLRNTYTLSVTKGEGIKSVSGGGSFEYGTPIQISCEVEIGYKFSAWVGEINYDEQNLISTMPATNLNLTATAVLASYSISFDNTDVTTSGTVESESYTLSSKNQVVKIYCPTKAGHTLTGLQLSGNIGNAYINSAKTRLTISAGTYGDIVITPIWQVKTYTVTLKVNDENYGTIDKAKLTEVPYGTEIVISDNTLTINDTIITALALQSTSEYTYKFESFTYTSLFVGQNLTIVANFSRSKNSYTITWKNYDGTILFVDSVEYRVAVKYQHETPFRPDNNEFTYVFDGWTPDVETATSNAEYTAVFRKVYKEYKIEWRDFDDNVLKITYSHYNTTPSFGGTPAKKGYTFAGWSPQISVVTEDTIYYATYTINFYTINFISESGSIDGETSRQIEYGTRIGSLPTITDSKGTFMGWYLSDGTKVDENTVFDFDSDITITAKFKNDFGTFMKDYYLYFIIGIGAVILIGVISLISVKAHKSKHKKRGYYSGSNRPKPPFKK